MEYAVDQGAFKEWTEDQEFCSRSKQILGASISLKLGAHRPESLFVQKIDIRARHFLLSSCRALEQSCYLCFVHTDRLETSTSLRSVCCGPARCLVVRCKVDGNAGENSGQSEA